MSINFTLVTTVFNEISRIDQTIQDIEKQTIIPTEIVIVDAGSKDGTFERLLRWKQESNIKIVVIQQLRCNVAAGRNLAIKNSTNEIIVSTDFGCRFHKQWIESLLQEFNNQNIDIVGGAFSVIEKDVETLAAKADYVLQNAYPINLDQYFSVSSRSIAYKKHVWQEVGGYLEWLTLAADDTIFWRQIKQHNFRYVLVDKAFVYWGRHKTFKAFAKEAYRYGLGDGESKINFRNFVSTFAETILRYLLFIYVLTICTWLNFNWFISILPIFFLLLGLRSYINSYKNWKKLRSEKYNSKVFLSSLYLIELSRYQYIIAYIKGWLFSSEKVKTERKKLNIK